MMQEAYTGVLPVMKEKGYTSNDVVAKLRGMLHMKKIGHTGTLDPDATGVLPVCLGRATKLVGYLTDTDKEYRCVMRLGVTTDTEDMSGKVLTTGDASHIDDAAIADAVRSFVGTYDQIPPMYSAKKINGKKLYELARDGQVVDRDPVRVYIREIDDMEISREEGKVLCSFRVACSKGTYIRSLCRDAGEKLGCGGAMEKLVRTGAAGIEIEECLTLSEIGSLLKEGGLEERIRPIDSFYADCRKLRITGRDEKAVRNGNKLFLRDTADGRYRVYLQDGTFAAIYDIKDGEAKLCRFFLT